MTTWIAFSGILYKDMRNYYLKPPNISWGIIFPVAWTLMFFVRSQGPVDIQAILPGVMALSVLFGTTSMLAVTITFERRSKSFDRLLLAPISLQTLVLAKTTGAIVFGVINAFVPLVLARLITDLPHVHWFLLLGSTLMIAITSTFLGLTIAVSASEVFEAQTFSNFLRFPMIFLCGLFIPIDQLPLFLRPLSYALPLTYGVEILRSGITGQNFLPNVLSFVLLLLFAVGLFAISVRSIRQRWIV